EWTKIQSGDLVGWANNEYLLFDEDAEELASSVGYKIIYVKTDALRVRMEPDTNAGILGLVADGDDLEVIDDSDSEWIKVNYDGDEGYVAAEYVAISFSVDSGETVEAVKAREEAERKEKEKKQLTAKQSAVIANADETRLLAALIQCEAGSVDYEGCLAVGAVVMNRVRSGAYPATISGVIYASGQFSPARNGRLAAAYNGNISGVCVQAAQAALAGETNVGTATHFRRAGGQEGIIKGGHVFW
ncbi:MAG: cell wall hydrolase, partial [Clostridiales bacterium]|nr:cell wall hydrolase [Candidatus Crickella merdequi]